MITVARARAVIAAIGVIVIYAACPASSQTPPAPVVIPDVFDPDLAAVKMSPALQAAIKNAADWARLRDPCYPPTSMFKVVVKKAPGIDPLFLRTLAEARVAA